MHKVKEFILKILFPHGYMVIEQFGNCRATFHANKIIFDVVDDYIGDDRIKLKKNYGLGYVEVEMGMTFEQKLSLHGIKKP